MMADEATQGIDPDGSEKIMEEAHVIPLWQGIDPADNDSKWCWFCQISSRNDPTMEICLLHAQWCCTPSGVISGLPSLSRGSQRLGFTTDANVSLSYPPSEALQLVSISVERGLFVHHMFPSENCHIQAHGWSSYGGRLQPFHVWVLLPTPW